MDIIKSQFTYYKRRKAFLADWLQFFRDVRFAWRHPRKVMVSVKSIREDEIDIHIHWGGMNERMMLQTLTNLGEHSREMCETQDSLTNLIKDN